MNMPRYGVQKYVTAIHRRKLVKNCGCGQGRSQKFVLEGIKF